MKAEIFRVLPDYHHAAEVSGSTGGSSGNPESQPLTSMEVALYIKLLYSTKDSSVEVGAAVNFWKDTGYKRWNSIESIFGIGSDQIRVLRGKKSIIAFADFFIKSISNPGLSHGIEQEQEQEQDQAKAQAPK